jgi:RNA polymerase sigma-70 factor, ECF subfamily
MKQETPDETIARQIRNGETAAFAELYSRHKQVVYLYCTRFLGRTAAAEDIFQDVFLKCFEQLRQGKAIANMRAYLLSAAHNRCLNFMRDTKYAQCIDEVKDLIPAPRLDQDDAQTLHLLLQQISAENREALLLCEYQGYSYNEIAEMTSVPLSTVRKRIFRARQKLRALLGAVGFND